jgi:hypothetical protein
MLFTNWNSFNLTYDYVNEVLVIDAINMVVLTKTAYEFLDFLRVVSYLLMRGGWGVEWIQLAQDRDLWRDLVNTVMNLRVLAPRS